MPESLVIKTKDCPSTRINDPLGRFDLPHFQCSSLWTVFELYASACEVNSVLGGGCILAAILDIIILPVVYWKAKPDLVSKCPYVLFPIILIWMLWVLGTALYFCRRRYLRNISEAFRCRLCPDPFVKPQENEGRGSREQDTKSSIDESSFRIKGPESQKINDRIFDLYRAAVDEKGFIDLVIVSRLLEQGLRCEGLYGLCDWHWDKEHGV